MNTVLLRMFRVALVALWLATGPSAAHAQTNPTIYLQLVVTGLQGPTFVTAPPGDRHRLFVVERAGRIRIVQDGVLASTPFLDISALVRDSGYEQGMLSLAFHPDYADNGYFYISYTAESPANAVVIARYSRSSDPGLADPASGLAILTVEKTRTRHNGGQLQFDRHGYLVISLGDDGTNDAAQDISLLLGKILRIDVNSGAPYAIPANNPFVNTPSARGEIWAFGLRNPWRFGIDRLTGDLWIGDVGEFSREEIDREVGASSGGVNWGWPCREGTLAGPDPLPSYCSAILATLQPPVFDYSHTLGCSVTGGFVYRGSPNSSYFGRYFLSDYCPDDTAWYLAYNGSSWPSTRVVLQPPAGHRLQSAVSFGEDAMGNLYVLDLADGDLYQLLLRPSACVAGNNDVNGDGIVGIGDVQLVAGDWLRPDFVPDYDVNCSGGVDILDVQGVAAAWQG